MIGAILIILIVLWVFGYIQIGIPDLPLFVINGNSISLWDILILVVVAWAIGILPSPLRQIAGVLLAIWVLATLGIIAISGLASIIVLAIIIGLVLSLIGAI